MSVLLMEYHDMKAYREVEVNFHALLTFLNPTGYVMH